MRGFSWRTRAVLAADANVEYQGKKVLGVSGRMLPPGNFINWTESIFWSRVEGSMLRARLPGRGLRVTFFFPIFFFN